MFTIVCDCGCRLMSTRDSEEPQVVRDYNAEMRRFFDSGACGKFNYADVYNMTAQLSLEHPAQAAQMTFDKVHWGMEVNLIKAQIILNALIAKPQ